MKFSKTNAKQMREFMEKIDANGCVTCDQWTSGSGRYTSPKVLPPFVEKYEKREYKPTNRPAHGTPERTAMDFFFENPKRKFVLVLDKAAAMDFFFEAARGTEI